jgi:hypothetical protein
VFRHQWSWSQQAAAATCATANPAVMPSDMVTGSSNFDLGIVRDSTLNKTNDYPFFTGSWEAVVPKVTESCAVTSTL